MNTESVGTISFSILNVFSFPFSTSPWKSMNWCDTSYAYKKRLPTQRQSQSNQETFLCHACRRCGQHAPQHALLTEQNALLSLTGEVNVICDHPNYKNPATILLYVRFGHPSTAFQLPSAVPSIILEKLFDRGVPCEAILLQTSVLHFQLFVNDEIIEFLCLLALQCPLTFKTMLTTNLNKSVRDMGLTLSLCSKPVKHDKKTKAEMWSANNSISVSPFRTLPHCVNEKNESFIIARLLAPRSNHHVSSEIIPCRAPARKPAYKFP